jgi:lipoate-protein ligase A
MSAGDYPRTTWRLICSPPADGATNMAADEAILRTIAAGQAPSTLRLYAWEPACLSLGRAQSLSDVNLEALYTAGFDLVRRPTGGKAILHVDELTYSVVAPQGEPRVAGGIMESYRRLSAGLMRGLELLGVANLGADRRVPPENLSPFQPEGPVCFEAPSDYEITAGERKLVGSAQMRTQRMVLQHGALPLHGDIARICPLLTAHPDPARVRGRATTLAEALASSTSTRDRQPVTWDEAADALVRGFTEALNLDLKLDALTDAEHTWTEELRAGKYTTDDWTGRV